MENADLGDAVTFLVVDCARLKAAKVNAQCKKKAEQKRASSAGESKKMAEY